MWPLLYVLSLLCMIAAVWVFPSDRRAARRRAVRDARARTDASRERVRSIISSLNAVASVPLNSGLAVQLGFAVESGALTMNEAIAFVRRHPSARIQMSRTPASCSTFVRSVLAHGRRTTFLPPWTCGDLAAYDRLFGWKEQPWSTD